MKLLIILAALALTGCAESSYTEKTGEYRVPKELEDCKIFVLQGKEFNPAITVVRCPTETTASYRTGKALRTVSVN